MKKLILLISLVFNSSINFAANVPLWENETYYWKYFEDVYLGNIYQIRTFNTDIKIQLTGDYTIQDSLFIENLISQLKPLIRKVRINMVPDKGNLSVKLRNNKDTTNRIILKDFRYIYQTAFFSDSIKKSKRYRYYTTSVFSFYNIHPNLTSERNQNGLSNNQILISFNNDIPQVMRNKLLEYYIINSLFQNVDRYKKDIRTKYRDSTFLLTGNNALTTEFKEIDKFVIYKAYSRFLFFELLLKKPKPAMEYLKITYGNYSYLIAFCISFFVLLLYFILLLRYKIIERKTTNWKTFMTKGMWIMQSATIIYIFYAFVEHKLFYSNANTLLFILLLIGLPNLISFLSLNFIYFFEKKLINNNTSIPLRLFIQFVSPAIPLKITLLLVSIAFEIRNNVIFITFLVMYSLLFMLLRLLFNYLQYKTENTIKEKDIEMAHLREMQQKAELQALQSRINPHFLYNALNSIAGLAKTDAEKTEHMALALSDFCRYAINKQNETFSTVQEEVEMVKTFLEIEKTRFGEKFSYSVDIADDCRKALIPRFVIQPLIENAIKHGVGKITETGVLKFQVMKTFEGLKLVVFDNGPAFPDMPVSGYGLQSIYDKLELIYKGKASINWINAPEKCIFITIPYSLV